MAELVNTCRHALHSNMTTLLNTMYNQIEQVYSQRFGVESPKSPKYLKYIMIAFAGTGFIIIRKIFWTLFNKLRSYPPGPIGLPIFGCLFQFGSNPRKFLVNITNQYGPIAYVPLLFSNNAFISDVKILRQVFQKPEFGQSPNINRPPIAVRPTPMLADINGKSWENRRKYALTTVINLTKTSFVLSHIKKCIKNIEQDLNKKYISNNKLWFPSDYMHYIAMNNVFSAIFDYDLSFNDPFINKYSKWGDAFFDRVGIIMMIEIFFNNLIKLPIWLKKKIAWNHALKGDEILFEWMTNNGFIVDLKNKILKRKNVMIKSKVYFDFLMTKLKENEMTFDQVINDIHVILAAGVDTTSKAAEYGFLLLAKYPKIQEMIYKELQNVMKENNLKEFDFSIINKLHIFRAFIYEVLRISCVSTTGIPHITTNDFIVNVDGKKIVIPKYTMLHANMYFTQKFVDWNDINNVYEEENNEIHLEYWLKDVDGDGNKKFYKNDNFIMFGVGKRDCPGQSLAIKALYATFGLMINKYKFIAKNDNPNELKIKQSYALIMHIDPPIGIQIQLR